MLQHSRRDLYDQFVIIIVVSFDHLDLLMKVTRCKVKPLKRITKMVLKFR